MKLEHLAPYLPYELKIVWFNKKSKDIYKIGFDSEIDFDNSIYPLSTLIFTINQGKELGWKPILRPLSDLTKEIEHNGEKFVPMLKLFELAWKMKYEGEEDKFDFRDLLGNGYGAFELNRKIALVYRKKEFICTDWTSSEYYRVSNQLTMFQKLFEWHFDVFGLIEKGLAIDKNTIN